MTTPTLQEIEAAHGKVAEMIEAFKAARQTFVIPEASLELKIGERYAGIVLDEEGEPSHHLILLDTKPDSKLNWKDALAWAEGIGATLPTRFEAALLYANLRSQFDENYYHWTATQSSDASAWIQYFGLGTQHYDDKYDTFLCRAVRRLEI